MRERPVRDRVGDPEGFFAISDRTREATAGIADLMPDAENSLRCCAPLARGSPASAAANTWRENMERCAPVDRLLCLHAEWGAVHELAADAVLCQIPGESNCAVAAVPISPRLGSAGCRYEGVLDT